jgi:hypothetical protein
MSSACSPIAMVEGILGILGKVAGGVADRIFPDPEQELKRIELQQALQAAVLERTSEIERAAAEVVKAEAQGQSWLQRTWRPITMLVFVGLIVARWLGWSAPNLGEAEVLKLWDIVEIGLGGYVIGRSAEKILPGVVSSFQKK